MSLRVLLASHHPPCQFVDVNCDDTQRVRRAKLVNGCHVYPVQAAREQKVDINHRMGEDKKFEG